jgi:hypothetical protein
LDGHEFDTVVKAFSSGTSRRRVLRGLLGSALAGTAAASRTFEATAGKVKRCPSANGSDCSRTEICNNQTHICEKCEQRYFETCKGSIGPGACCYKENAHCCTCTHPSGLTFGRCAGIGQSCSALDQPEIGVVCA